MRTILINPEAQTVTELDLESGLKNIQLTVGCSCVTVLRIEGDNNDAIWVDDEGLLNPSGFVFEYQGHPLVGNGLIIGADDEGDSIGTALSLDDVKDSVVFFGEQHFDV